MIIGYVRVSSVDQNSDRQLVTMEKYKVDKIFSEKVSAKDIKRPKLQELLSFINNFYEINQQLNEEQRQSLTVVIHDFSRLARSTKDLLDIVELFESKNVTLISAKENIDTSTPTGKLMLTMIGAINEFERANLLERQREGIAEAKKQGKYKGRKEVEIQDFDKHYNRYITREINKSQLAKELNISRPTLNKLIEEHEKGNPITKKPRDIYNKDLKKLSIEELKQRISLKERIIKEQQVKKTSGIYKEYEILLNRLNELEGK